MNLIDLLRNTLELGGSDLFIVPGRQAKVKVNGKLVKPILVKWLGSEQRFTK